MSSFTGIIDGIAADGDGFTTHVPQNWAQGRTTYGGMSASLCVAAAVRQVEGLPPLRAAQFMFIGPAAGALRITARVLRQGKNSVFIGADLVGEAGLATRATLSFVAARQSSLNYLARAMPQVPPPLDGKPFFPNAERPSFTTNFETRGTGRRSPKDAPREPDLLLWVRHNDPAARHGLAPLIALGDALPPAAIPLFPHPAPISSISWGVDMIHPEAAVAGSPDGWHLLQSRADHVADGYTSQEMTVWNEAGLPLLAARQTIAIFV